MSAKPETTFYTSVHRHLPSKDVPYRLKTFNPYVGGPADHWYSGQQADLWVEWKFIKLPVRDSTLIDLVSGKNPPLSKLQQDWLRSRHEEGRNVWVVVGCKEGGVIYTHRKWEVPIPTGSFRTLLLSRAAIAQRLAAFTCSSHELSTTVHDRPSHNRHLPSRQHHTAPYLSDSAREYKTPLPTPEPRERNP